MAGTAGPWPRRGCGARLEEALPSSSRSSSVPASPAIVEPPSDVRMPIATRTARAFATACLVVATLLTALPTPAAALEPPRPLPGYRADFVTQTDKRPMNELPLGVRGDAPRQVDQRRGPGQPPAAAREVRRPRGRLVLRRAEGRLREVRLQAEVLPGRRRRGSPGASCCPACRKGAGAILLGDYGKLPRYYGRWDHKFWKKKGKKDNHAVYIERYDRSRGRVWLMDPLARGDWEGEWISVWALRKFAWSLGRLRVRRHDPDREGRSVREGQGDEAEGRALVRPAVDASWTLKTPKRWKFPGANAKAVFETAEDPLLAAAHVAAAAGEDDRRRRARRERGVRARQEPPPRRAAADRARRVRGDARRPGPAVREVLRDRRRPRGVHPRRPAGDDAPRTPAKAGVEAGSALKVSINVANTGTETWARHPGRHGRRAGGDRPDDARRGAVGQARRSGRRRRAAAKSATRRDDSEPSRRRGPRAAGTGSHGPRARARSSSPTRSAAGRSSSTSWMTSTGRIAALGSAPAVHVVDVVAARGFEPIE